MVAEAGLEANLPPSKLTDDQLCEALFGLAEEVGRFPSNADMEIKRSESKDFPARQTVTKRLGQAHERAQAFYEWAKGNDCDVTISSIFLAETKSDNGNVRRTSRIGWVYLIKQGQFYKLGAADNPARRLRELANQTSEDTMPEHEIKAAGSKSVKRSAQIESGCQIYFSRTSERACHRTPIVVPIFARGYDRFFALQLN